MNINHDMPEHVEKKVAEFNATMRGILDKYGVPDPAIVGKLPKGGIQLDYVSHAEITRILIQIDPLWDWEPVAFDDNGLPAFAVINGMAHMTGRLTIHGVTRIGVGSVQHNKPDIIKELVSDFLRNAAMRFGIALSLWSKSEWETGGDDVKVSATPGRPVAKEKAKVGAKVAATPDKGPLTDAQKQQFVDACQKKSIDVQSVCDEAGIQLDKATNADLPALRAAFKHFVDLRNG
jgi:hypothetical protein